MDTTIRTDIAGRQIIERRHWSFSAIEKFVNCARRFQAYDVVKSIKEPTNPQMMEGQQVHNSMAKALMVNTPLPANLANYQPWIDNLLSRPRDKMLVEQKMACTFELEPCEYFSRVKKVWLRTVADVLVLNGSHCVSWDWKTGQEKDERYELLPKHFQLKLVALTVFLHHPKIQTVESAYVYLPTGQKVGFDMKRSDLREFIPIMYDVVGGMQRAVRNNQFPPRPSGICKRHCGVTGCEYHGKGAH